MPGILGSREISGVGAQTEAELEDAVLASSCVWPFPPQWVKGVGWCARSNTRCC